MARMLRNETLIDVFIVFFSLVWYCSVMVSVAYKEADVITSFSSNEITIAMVSVILCLEGLCGLYL